MISNGMNKKLLLVLGLIVLLASGYLVYQLFINDQPAESPTQEQLDRMNADDPTLENEKSSEPTEKDSEDTTQPTTTTTTNSAKKSTAVTISFAGAQDNLVVTNAFADVFENGKCTFVYSKGNDKKTYTENTEEQSSYTQCNPNRVPRSEFSSGTWKVVVVFESDNYKGQAEQEFPL